MKPNKEKTKWRQSKLLEASSVVSKLLGKIFGTRLKKQSKIGEEQNTLKPDFVQFLTTNTKISFLKG